MSVQVSRCYDAALYKLECIFNRPVLFRMCVCVAVLDEVSKHILVNCVCGGRVCAVTHVHFHSGATGFACRDTFDIGHIQNGCKSFVDVNLFDVFAYAVCVRMIITSVFSEF